MVLAPFTVSPAEPGGIALGPDGNMWFTDSYANHIGRITPDGVVTEYTLPTVGMSPHSIVAGPDGNSMWFLENLEDGPGGRVARISMSGVIRESVIKTGEHTALYDLAAGGDGNLWITVFRPDGIARLNLS